MPDTSLAKSLLFLREEELRLGVELMFSAEKDFAETADDLLITLGLERIHHRILHIIARQPEITMSALGSLIGVSKQSLGRALDRLFTEQLVIERVGLRDRRQRILVLSEKGAVLERQISDCFARRLARAYRDAGAQAVEGFRRVLIGLIDDSEYRRRLAHTIGLMPGSQNRHAE